MVDWLSSMEQSYEYYIVDPKTWKDDKKLATIKTSTINRDSEVETLGSATIDTTDLLEECYIRIYLVTIQNGVTEKHALGTFLVQTPSSSFDGKVRDISMDAYTPLLELKEKLLPLGYYIPKYNEDSTDDTAKVDILTRAYEIARENMRAPIIATESDVKLRNNDFVADPEDSVLKFLIDLVKNAKYRLALDETSRVIFEPDQKIDHLQPVWTYNDDNSSILYPELSMEHDLYGVPNVVEVIYSNGLIRYDQRVENHDPDSPTSIERRGREIVHRVTDPGFAGIPTEAEVIEYANNLLKELSTIEYTVTYTHGYCPVRLGDCVRLNYSKAGLNNVKAKVISQSIKCVPGCPVTEKAVFTKKLWG